MPTQLENMLERYNIPMKYISRLRNSHLIKHDKTNDSLVNIRIQLSNSHGYRDKKKTSNEPAKNFR